MSDVLNHRTRVRTGSRTSPQYGFTVLHAHSPLLRPSSEAPPSVLRFGGARQPYLESGFAETANLPVHYEFACTQGCLKRLIEKIGGRLTRSAFPPRFILGQN